MTRNNQLHKSDIIFFRSDPSKYTSSQLKNFIHFLNSNGIKRPYKFSNIEGEGALIPNLSIRENIHLDSVPNQLSTSKDIHLSKLLEKTGNSHLLEMFNFIPELDNYPEKVNEQVKKLASLIKGMIQEADYLFLEKPEMYLEEKHLDLFLKAIHYQAKSLGQIVFVHSQDEKFWRSHISKIVTRGDKNEFLVTPVICNVNQEVDPNEKEAA
jgi:ABC-type lipoprotein export system ATPase subunit